MMSIAMTEDSLWDDMAKLNALYEELCWAHDDTLSFSIEDGRIVITNVSQSEDFDIIFNPDDEFIDRMNEDTLE